MLKAEKAVLFRIFIFPFQKQILRSVDMTPRQKSVSASALLRPDYNRRNVLLFHQLIEGRHVGLHDLGQLLKLRINKSD